MFLATVVWAGWQRCRRGIWKLGVTPKFMVVRAFVCKSVHLCAHGKQRGLTQMWTLSLPFPVSPILSVVLIVWMVGLSTHGNRELGPDHFHTNPQNMLLSRAAGALRVLSSSALSTQGWTRFMCTSLVLSHPQEELQPQIWLSRMQKYSCMMLNLYTVHLQYSNCLVLITSTSHKLFDK